MLTLSGRFSPEFIETRRRELDKFLNRIAQHTILHKRPEFILFVEAKDEQFNNTKNSGAMNRPKPRQDTSAESSPQSSGSIGSSIVSFFGHSLSAVSSSLNAAVSGAKEIDQWFDSKKVCYLISLYN